MAVIWGLDLQEMQWSKFKGSYMFGNKDYHLRRTKFVVYQLAMIFCVVSESLGTAALSDYVEQQSQIESMHSPARIHNDDFVGAASYNIFVGIAVATIFGAAFFFDLFWPERYEPINIRWAWRICAIIVSCMALGDALAFTIITATHKSWISANDADARDIAMMVVDPPLVYKHNSRAIASVVILWLGWAATIMSTCVMCASYKHIGRYGPKSHSARRRQKTEKSEQADPTAPVDVQAAGA